MLSVSQLNAILPNWDRADWYYSIELCPGIYTKGFGFNAQCGRDPGISARSGLNCWHVISRKSLTDHESV
jgi:hypothetical protein